MRLSKNFTLNEFTRSQTASRRGIANKPDEDQIEAIKLLVEHILQPTRDHFNRAISISSGFRSKKLNKAIGGSSTSQHTLGEAADFTVAGISDRDVCEFIRDNLDFDQLILEFPEHGWIHISYRAGRLRKETLTAVKRKRLGRLRTVYLDGLV